MNEPTKQYVVCAKDGMFVAFGYKDASEHGKSREE